MKKCMYCGAQIENGNLFCTECGKPVPQGKSCPHCGASVSDEDAFCQNCGKKIAEEPVATHAEPLPDTGQSVKNVYDNTNEGNLTHQNYSKRILYFVLALALIVVTCFGYKYFINNNHATDDGIELDDMMGKKEMKVDGEGDVESDKVAVMREELSPERVFALVNNINNTALAKPCGLEEIYNYEYSVEGDEDDPGEYVKIVIYGREIKKGNEIVNGSVRDVDLISNSAHSCYIKYMCVSDDGYVIAFKDKEDAYYFFNKVIEEGVNKDNGNGTYDVDFIGIREGNVNNVGAFCTMSEVKNFDGWYVILLNIVPIQ